MIDSAVLKIQEWWPAFTFGGLVACIVILVVGWIAKRVIKKRLPLKNLSPNRRELVTRVVGYGIFLLTLGLALNAIGVKLGVVLGAMGVLTIGLSFAAQNTVSNLLSGIFLMIEEPFEIGDWVQVGAAEGTLIEIRLLSFRIRTFDYRLVRVPSKTVFDSIAFNMNAYERRRVSIPIGVGYGEDLLNVKRVLFEVAANCEYALKDPGPVLFGGEYADSSVTMTFGVWVKTSNFAIGKFTLMAEVLKAFATENIEIPFPYRQLVAGQGDPVSIRLLEGGAAATGTDGAGGTGADHESGKMPTAPSSTV
jgi:small-conductance mechanosensitive channel